MEQTDGHAKIEWQKLKLLEETTINDVLLASDTEVSIESNAAKTLVDNGLAEVIDNGNKNDGDEETTEKKV